MAELDILVVGAGFSGVYQLWKLRNEGYKIKLVDAGSDFGGVWHWNRYPGLRVDSDIPHYEYSIPEVWKDWKWSERYPGGAELQKYFAHVDRKLDLRKDCQFNTVVTRATFDGGLWHVDTKDSGSFKTRYLLLNIGIGAKRYTPDLEGIDTYQGQCLHSSSWPQTGLDMHGKRIAVIGTGATGVQIAQQAAKVGKELIVFQRTPNLALPMGQKKYFGGARPKPEAEYPRHFCHRNETFSGFTWDFNGRKTFDDTPEQRRETYENLWKQGDFQFWLATYNDMLFDPKANEEAYNFWRDKTRQRIKDPRKQELLAPMIQPHPFGTKRPSLEQGYFEVFNQDNVELVDINATPIVKLTKKGIQTAGKEYEVDIVILATGFDSVTGPFKQIDIRGPSGLSLSEKWADGSLTYLGVSANGFPNMFFTYGPQAPTGFCNGPTCSEMQGNWIADCLNYMREHQLSTIEPTHEAETNWRQVVHDFAFASLLPRAKSVSHSKFGSHIPLIRANGSVVVHGR
jgi:cation diffusion facilitator CzcD-associated flavoprotein CzcO